MTGTMTGNEETGPCVWCVHRKVAGEEHYFYNRHVPEEHSTYYGLVDNRCEFSCVLSEAEMQN